FAIEPAVRFVDAGRVNQDDLPGGTAALPPLQANTGLAGDPGLGLHVDHTLNPRARCLRLFRDNGDLFAYQSVQQRAFAGVGPADDGNESGAEGHATWRPLVPGLQAAPGSRALSPLCAP